MKIGEFYKFLHPKITVLIGSRWEKDNVMACAWLTPVSEDPPLLIACIDKDSFTAKQILNSKEFTISIPDFSMKDKVLICGRKSGKDVDKAKIAGIKYKNAKCVKAPIVDGCIGYIECKVMDVIDGGECYAFLSKVLDFYVEKNYKKKYLLLHLRGDKFMKAKILG